MGGNKLMGIAVIILGIAFIVLGMGMAYRNLNSAPTTDTEDTNVKPYAESSYMYSPSSFLKWLDLDEQHKSTFLWVIQIFY